MWPPLGLLMGAFHCTLFTLQVTATILGVAVAAGTAIIRMLCKQNQAEQKLPLLAMISTSGGKAGVVNTSCLQPTKKKENKIVQKIYHHCRMGCSHMHVLDCSVEMKGMCFFCFCCFPSSWGCNFYVFFLVFALSSARGHTWGCRGDAEHCWSQDRCPLAE